MQRAKLAHTDDASARAKARTANHDRKKIGGGNGRGLEGWAKAEDGRQKAEDGGGSTVCWREACACILAS